MLFNAVTDAIESLRANNYGEAMDILIRGQQEAEEAYPVPDEDRQDELL